MTADVRRWRGRVVAVFLVWFGICGVAAVFGSRPAYGLVALLVATVAGAVLLFLDTSAGIDAPQWHLPDTDPVRPAGEDPRMALLHRVVGAHLDAHEVDGTLHDHLMAVADRRLVSRHGVSRLEDPDRAAVLLGPELTAFAEATHPYPRLTTDQIAVLIERIEEL